MTETARTFTDGVRARLDHYAGRGAFRAFAELPNGRGSSGPRVAWRVRWHRDQPIEFVVDGRQRTLTLKNILPGVDRKSALDKNLRAFVTAQTGSKVPPHRRIGTSRDAVRITNRGGNVSIALKANAGADSQTLTDRAVLLGHQIYAVFLREGGYDEYLVEALGVDLDATL